MDLKVISDIKNYYASQIPVPYIHTYSAYSMSDVFAILEDIGQNVFKIKDDVIGRPLWFRGQSREDYTLIPSLYRERENKPNKSDLYSTFSLAEEYRHQNFAARVSHLTHPIPNSRTEWQELLQHHLGKTRFMDWSESLGTAINFALEPFIDTKDTLDNRLKRSMITPGIWVMNPYMLNEHVYDFFANGDNCGFIEKALRNLYPNKAQANKLGESIQKELIENKDIYFNFDNKKVYDISINGLVSICVLDEYCHYNENHMKYMLKNKEFNPFFYLLVRYYGDALPVEAGVNKNLLPPLASIQPYHSERIRAQRGTFTIFPNYFRTENAKQFVGTKMDVIAIEAQKSINKCFCNIRLCDPVQIVKEFLYAGERWPEIYPDIQIYADYLETKKFFI